MTVSTSEHIAPLFPNLNPNAPHGQEVASVITPNTRVLPTRSHAYPVLVTKLSGTQEMMGAQHGEQIRQLGQWRDVLGYYPGMPERMISSSLPAPLVKTLGRSVIETMLRSFERGRSKNDRARSRSFFRALGLPPSQARFLFVMDVLQNLVGLSRRTGAIERSKHIGLSIPPACSTLMAWGDTTHDGRLLHGRNFDFPGIGIWEKTPEVTFCSPAEKGSVPYGYVTTQGGDIGATFFNAEGITVAPHTRFSTRVTARGTGILDIVHRIAAHARTLDDALAIAKQALPIASSWGISISSARERSAIVLETAGKLMRVVRPKEGDDYLTCANRYRHAEMIPHEVTLSPIFVANSDGRQSALHRAAQEKDLTVAAMQALLGSHVDGFDHLVERAAGGVTAQSTSVQSVVVDPEDHAVYTTNGPCPSGAGTWVKIPWDWSSTASFETLPASAGTFSDHPNTASRFNQPNARKARASYIEAVAGENQAKSVEHALPFLERATRLDPTDPTYRTMAGAAWLRTGHAATAREHLDVALAVEHAPVWRAQALLWASRAALLDRDPSHARAMQQEILSLQSPIVAPYHDAVRADQSTPPTLAKLAKQPLRLHLADAGL